MMSRVLVSLVVAWCMVVVASAAPSRHVFKTHVDEKRTQTIFPSQMQQLATTTPSPDTPADMTSGYPQLFTRKTTSLLAEALHMLSRVKDVKERRWLESFVHRLASLADDLDRSSGQETTGESKVDKAKGLAEFSRSLAVNAGQLQEVVAQHVEKAKAEAEEKLKAGDGDLVQQLQVQPVKGQHKQMLKTNQTPKEENDDKAKHRQDKLKLEKIKEFEKKKLLKNIFSEVQKLREMGGKPQDVLDILKRNRANHMHVSEQPTDQVSKPDMLPSHLSTLAPTSGQLREAVTETHIARTTAVTSSHNHIISRNQEDEQEESNNNNVISRNQEEEESDVDDADDTSEEGSDGADDDLVKQLEEEKFILVTTPRAEQDEQ